MEALRIDGAYALIANGGGVAIYGEPPALQALAAAMCATDPVRITLDEPPEKTGEAAPLLTLVVDTEASGELEMHMRGDSLVVTGGETQRHDCRRGRGVLRGG